ncbi:MAG: hypothetical protein HYS81_02890 [Candidatus Aenigmatarchaeota archaeon]|nr:MAG: hypothetical protein HYS81_02890 [Candidatus Aenigmarchaeota archaeon]
MSHTSGFFGSATGIPSVPVEWLALFFTFATVYGILATVGKQNKSFALFQNNGVNVLLALVFAFFAAANRAFVAFFEANFISLVWVFVGLFILTFLLEVFGLRGKGAENLKEHPHFTIIGAGIILLMLVTFGFGLLGDFEVPLIGTRNAITLLTLLFIFQMLYYAYMGSGKGGK